MPNTERDIAFLDMLASRELAAGNDRLADAIWVAVESYSRDVSPTSLNTGNVVTLAFPARS